MLEDLENAPPPSSAPRSAADPTQAAWEAKLQAEARDGTSADPLATWVDYVRWKQDLVLQSKDKPSGLLPVLERCAHTFRDDARYASDARYLRIWIAYADLVRDAEPIFTYLHGRGIGASHALFWESWAAVLEAKRNLAQADAAYAQGIALRAQPHGRLEKAQVRAHLPGIESADHSSRRAHATRSAADGFRLGACSGAGTISGAPRQARTLRANPLPAARRGGGGCRRRAAPAARGQRRRRARIGRRAPAAARAQAVARGLD